jgi:hypothetical protein
MTPDYDLSSLQADQADIWFYLKVNAILAEILGDQSEHRTSPLALGAATRSCVTHGASETAGDTQQHTTGSRLTYVGLGQDEVN